MEQYQQQGEKHVSKDKIVTWKEVNDAQRTVQGHLKALARVFKPGEAHGEDSERRCREAKQVASLVIPHVYLMDKDH